MAKLREYSSVGRAGVLYTPGPWFESMYSHTMKFEDMLHPDQRRDFHELEKSVNEPDRDIEFNSETNTSAQDNLPELEKIDIPLEVITIEKHEADVHAREMRDRFFGRFSIENILQFTLKETPFEISEDGMITIYPQEKLTNLDPAYGFKGGMARMCLRKVLGLNAMPPRDLDIIRIAESEPWQGADKQISAHYMPDDYQHGHGVEVLRDNRDYLDSRDFTMNELIASADTIIASEDCIRDTLRNIVRVSKNKRPEHGGQYELGGYDLKVKAMRIMVEQMYFLGKASIPPEDWEKIDQSFVPPFWLALNLDRAYERSDEVAEQLVDLYKQNGMIPSHINSAAGLADYLEEDLGGGFYFRSAPIPQYDAEDWLAENGGSYTEVEQIEDYFERTLHGTKY